MQRISSLGPVLVTLAAVGCPRERPDAPPTSAPAAESNAVAAAAAPEKEDRWKPYRALSDAIGVREGIDAGLLRDGQTMEFIVTHPDTHQPLGDATMTIGDGPDAIVLRTDEKGRIAFPLRLDLVEKNPPVRLVSPSTEHPEFETNLRGTIRFHCDEKGFTADAQQAITPEQLAAMRHEDFGDDRVYVAPQGVTDADVKAMGKHLGRLRAAYREATGWEPTPLHVLLAPDPKSIAVAKAQTGDPAVWPLSPAQITDRDRGTAFLVHEWTHATLAARSSGAFDTSQRWIEDGLCELVALRVETRMFPRKKATRTSSRGEELSLPEAPEAFELVQVGEAKPTSMYGALVSMCDGTQTRGYPYAFAFWLAAVPEASALPNVLKELDAEPLLGVARKHAPKAFAELVIDRECAKKVIAGKPACAKG